MSEVLDKISEYLQVGGNFNPELMEHDKVRDMVIECRDEIERLKKKCNDQAMILRQFTYEKFPGVYFISCEYGPKDANGLPEKIGVVPAYGLDWHQIYVRTDKVNAPEW